MRKRFYIMLVARNSEGELLKIPIPLHYLYVFIAGALIGMLTITGMAGSYTRMLLKTQRFNELRNEKEALKSRYTQLEQIARRPLQRRKKRPVRQNRAGAVQFKPIAFVRTIA